MPVPHQAATRVKAIRDEVAGKAEDILARLSSFDPNPRQSLVRTLVRRVLIYRDGFL
jgi:hypothetical protein